MLKNSLSGVRGLGGFRLCDVRQPDDDLAWDGAPSVPVTIAERGDVADVEFVIGNLRRFQQVQQLVYSLMQRHSTLTNGPCELAAYPLDARCDQTSTKGSVIQGRSWR